MEQARRVPLIDLLDEMPGQAVAALHDHDAGIDDHADGAAGALDVVPNGAQPGRVLRALSQDAPNSIQRSSTSGKPFHATPVAPRRS